MKKCELEIKDKYKCFNLKNHQNIESYAAKNFYNTAYIIEFEINNTNLYISNRNK